MRVFKGLSILFFLFFAGILNVFAQDSSDALSLDIPDEDMDKISEMRKIPIEVEEKIEKLGISNRVMEDSFYFEQEKKRVFSELKGIKIAKYPKIENLKTIKTIYLHHAYGTVINIDNRYVIRYASSSAQMTNFSVDNNTILIQPPQDFLEGSIVIIVEEIKTGKRYVLNLLAKKYSPYDKYESTSSPLYLVYNLIDRKILSPYEVMDTYYTLKKKYPDKSTIVYIDGIGYKIEIDSKFSNLRINGKNYFIYPTYRN